MLRFCCLGSGSGGNAFIVEASDGPHTVRVLVDDGFTPAELERRLTRAGVEAGTLNAIFVTHEHGDHAGGAASFSKRRGLPVYATEGTAKSASLHRRAWRWQTIHSAGDVQLGPLRVIPVGVPHDASEPVQFIFSDDRSRLAIVTDLGHPDPAVAAMLTGLDTLVLEFNHDLEMLRLGPYAAPLKARIESDLGHLSNEQSIRLLELIDRSRLTRVVAAHLSRTNNRPELARQALAQVQMPTAVEYDIADQAEGLDWRCVGPQ